MLLGEIAQTSQRVAETRARLEKISHLADCLRRLSPEEREAGVAFLTGEMRQGRIGLGHAAIREAMPDKVSAGAALTVREVDETFETIAGTSGPGSAKAKLQALRSLLGRSTKEEQDFLTRLVFGELRQGAQEGVVIEAVAKAAAVTASSVRRATMLAGDLQQVAVAALTDGEAALSGFRLQLLSPVQPMLAQTAEEMADVFARHERVELEYKVDGVRVQVHRLGEDVRVFTRKLNEVTAAVPELVEAALALPVSGGVILDGEAIALTSDGRPAPFQTTMRRFGRRLNVDDMRRRLPLSPFYFDCLHLNGEDLIDRPAEERLAAARRLLPLEQVVPHTVASGAEEAQGFLQAALEAGHEGIVAKALDGPYEAGRRGAGWLKLKPVHTLDLVVLAVEWGSGRRSGLFSNLHLGARDPSGGLVMLGKTFKGMTDAVLRWQTQKLLELKVTEEGGVVYVRPELVVEIAFDGVQASPHYPGGMALRFARLKRYRPDKTADQADTVQTVRQVFEERAPH